MKYSYQIKLADTDAAGRIYFASACRIAHESFEYYMAAAGLDISAIIGRMPFVLPVVHLSARYERPLTLGETIMVDTWVKEIGSKSVSFDHEICNADGKMAVFVTITHAVVSKATSKAVPMPKRLRQALTKLA